MLSTLRQQSRVLPRLLPATRARPCASSPLTSLRSELSARDRQRETTDGAAFLAGLFHVLASSVAGSGAATAYCSTAPVDPETAVEMSNWSGTHTDTIEAVYSPETQEELQELLCWAHKRRQKVRPVGTGLSPNGLALQGQGMLSMAQLDAVVRVDAKEQTITVQAGARVSQILEALKKYGLTLDNFSSITEQQIAGWTQTSAHGTGARISTVDDMILSMTLVTPGKGVLKLSADGPNAELFRWARVGLGTLGVVSEVTLKCRPCYTLHEITYCSTVEELRKNHAELLRTYRHVRYMWVPYTDTVVVVASDSAKAGANVKAMLPEKQRVKPLRDLLQELDPACGNLDGLNFAELRGKLLCLDPLNSEHVAKVNAAEAEFWKQSAGERCGDSTAILGFECGGSQWVLENCFPCGTIEKPSLTDIDYMVELKRFIEDNGIAAASPIEQRWTSRSTSPMSPAFSPNEGDIFSWVGVIMYIADEDTAPDVKEKFREYAERHVDLTFKYGGVFHWAKIDLDFHQGQHRLADLRSNLRRRFDLETYRRLRRSLDPRNLLGNRLTDEALSK